MKSGTAIVLAVLPLTACSQVAGAQYREAMEYQVRAYQAERETARAKGDVLGMCTASAQVAAAYREARDAANSDAWQARRKEDCAIAREALDPGKFPPAAQPSFMGEPANGGYSPEAGGANQARDRDVTP